MHIHFEGDPQTTSNYPTATTTEMSTTNAQVITMQPSTTTESSLTTDQTLTVQPEFRGMQYLFNKEFAICDQDWYTSSI